MYGCHKGPRPGQDDGLFFCSAHLSYGYARTGICHSAQNAGGVGSVVRAWDGPISSPFVRRSLSNTLPPSAHGARAFVR